MSVRAGSRESSPIPAATGVSAHDTSEIDRRRPGPVDNAHERRGGLSGALLEHLRVRVPVGKGASGIVGTPDVVGIDCEHSHLTQGVGNRFSGQPRAMQILEVGEPDLSPAEECTAPRPAAVVVAVLVAVAESAARGRDPHAIATTARARAARPRFARCWRGACGFAYSHSSASVSGTAAKGSMHSPSSPEKLPTSSQPSSTRR